MSFFAVSIDAVDRRAVEIATQLVVTTDQTADCIAHVPESPEDPERKLTPLMRANPLVGLHFSQVDRNGYAVAFWRLKRTS